MTLLNLIDKFKYKITEKIREKGIDIFLMMKVKN